MSAFIEASRDRWARTSVRSDSMSSIRRIRRSTLTASGPAGVQAVARMRSAWKVEPKAAGFRRRAESTVSSSIPRLPRARGRFDGHRSEKDRLDV